MKKSIAFIAALLLMVSGFALIGCGKKDEETVDYGTESYVTIEVNPIVEFVVGEDGTVEAVNAVNEDADVLLSDTDLTGISIEDATEEFIEMATESGYLDVDADSTDGNEVGFDVIGDEDLTTLEDVVKKAINDYFAENGIYGHAVKQMHQELQQAATELGVSLQQYRLMNRIITTMEGYTLGDLMDLTTDELIAILKNNFKNEQLGSLRDEMKLAFETLKQQYAAMFVLEEEIAALQLQIENFAEGGEVDLVTLQAQLQTKLGEYTVMHANYMAAKLALLQQYKTQYQQLKETLHQQKTALKQQYQNAFQAHKNGLSNAIRDAVRQWQDARA